MDQLLQYLAAINGHSNLQLAQMSPNVIPATPQSTSSAESPSSSSTRSSSYDSEDETSDDESITSMASDRQLRPRIPINYNETILRRLHGQPQVRTLNNISIPLPSDSTDEDTAQEDGETDEDSEQFI